MYVLKENIVMKYTFNSVLMMIIKFLQFKKNLYTNIQSFSNKFKN